MATCDTNGVCGVSLVHHISKGALGYGTGKGVGKSVLGVERTAEFGVRTHGAHNKARVGVRVSRKIFNESVKAWHGTRHLKFPCDASPDGLDLNHS